MSKCVQVLDGVVYVDGVRQEWTLPPQPEPLTAEQIEERLAAIYGAEAPSGGPPR